MNQFTVIENQQQKRPDLVLFVNGLPLAVIELKNPASEKTTVKAAFRQLQTYQQAQSPSCSPLTKFRPFLTTWKLKPVRCPLTST